MKQDQKSKFGRRDFLRAVGAGAGLAVTAAAPLATEAAAAETPTEERKARYDAKSADVKNLLSRQPLSDEVREAPVLIRKSERTARQGRLTAALSSGATAGVDRRAFLRRSGLAAGALAAIGTLPLTTVRKAEAAAAGPLTSGATIRKSICTHCAVGCTVTAEVSNGVWVGQEPSWDSPINRGSHCAKGASVRELVSGERRLKYPMKLENGKWTRIKWDQAIDEIGDKLMAVREKSGADAVYWMGSAKMTNEASYLVPEDGRVLGHQQHRPSGAHLPFDDRHRRGQYLGLRRDDE